MTPAMGWVGHKTRNKTKYSLCRVIVHGDTGHRLSGTQDEEQVHGDTGHRLSGTQDEEQVHGDTGHRLSGTQDEEQVHGDTGHRLGGTQDEEQDETLTVQGHSAR